MIGVALITLEGNPGERQRLISGELAMDVAIDELIRYDTSLSVGMRHVNSDLDLPGGRVPADASVMLVYPSAHRDPAIFRNPDCLDLGRQWERAPLPFGGGRYFCLGPHLARIEIEEALSAVLRLMPDYRAVDEAWQGCLIAHGPRRLIVSSR